MSPCCQKSFITQETRVKSSQDNAMQGGVGGGSGMAIFFFPPQQVPFASCGRELNSQMLPSV